MTASRFIDALRRRPKIARSRADANIPPPQLFDTFQQTGQKLAALDGCLHLNRDEGFIERFEIVFGPVSTSRSVPALSHRRLTQQSAKMIPFVQTQPLPKNLDVRLAVFDWAGTTVDFGCLPPVEAFVKTFAQRGVVVTTAEASMGRLTTSRLKS